MKNNFQPPFGIVGMGKSGVAAFRLLAEILKVPHSHIHRFDNNIGKSEYKNLDEFFKIPFKTLVVSPGVPLKSSFFEKFLENGGVITSEISLACQFLQNESIVGVTGSVGKSTTTSLIGWALERDGVPSFVGGNLGTPLADYILAVENKQRQRAEWLVLELSSYQLENCAGLKLDNSIITFLSPNHLERYSSLKDYYQTKLQIIKMTKEIVFLNKSSTDLVREISEVSESFPHRWVDKNSLPSVDIISNARLLGNHNMQNIRLSYAFLKQNFSDTCASHTLTYSGLPHRIENLGRKGRVTYINDSKATSIDSVIAAVNSLKTENVGAKIVLLLGGRDKGLPWEELQQLKTNSKLQFIFFGECGDLIKKKTHLSGPVFSTLKTALEKLPALLVDVEIVLLSPGGTSLDEFSGFEDRGNYFKEWFKTMASAPSKGASEE